MFLYVNSVVDVKIFFNVLSGFFSCSSKEGYPRYIMYIAGNQSSMIVFFHVGDLCILESLFPPESSLHHSFPRILCFS